MGDILENKWLRKYFKVLLVPAVFLLYYFLVYLVNPYTDYWKFEERRPYDLTIEFGGIMTFCYLMVESCLFISRRLNTVIPWEERPSNAPLYSYRCNCSSRWRCITAWGI